MLKFSRASLLSYIFLGFVLLYPVKFILLKTLYIYVAASLILITTASCTSGQKAILNVCRSFFLVSGIYVIPFFSLATTDFPDETLSALISVSINVALALLSSWKLMSTSASEKPIAKISCAFPLVLFFTSLIVLARFGTLRPSGIVMYEAVGSLSNHAAAISVLCIPHIAWSYKYRVLSRYILSLSFACVVAVVLFSLSRAATLLLLVTIISLVLPLSNRLHNAVAKFVFLLMTTLTLAYFSFALEGRDSIVLKIFERFSESQVLSAAGTWEPDPNLGDYGRAAMYFEGVQMTREYWPIGAGFGGLKPYMEQTLPFGFISHNLIITAAGELGLIGLLSYAAIFAAIYLRLKRLARDPSRRMKDLGGVSIVFLAIFILFSFSRPFEGMYIFPILVGFVLQIPTAPQAQNSEYTLSERSLRLKAH